MDPELLPGGGISVPDPAKKERADFICQFRPVNFVLCVQYCRAVV